MKTKNVDDNTILNLGLTMVLECNTQAKEERLKRARGRARDDRLLVRNSEFQCVKKIF